LNPSEKCDFVSWDYDIPNGKIIQMFQTTNQMTTSMQTFIYWQFVGRICGKNLWEDPAKFGFDVQWP